MPDGPLINAVLTYDASDTTTADDGFSVFVTPNGARWKADLSTGYDVRLAGYSKSRNNIAACLNKIISAIVTGIVSDGSFTTQQCVINVYSDSTASAESEHIVSETILTTTFITLKHHGGRHIYKANDDIVVFKIDNAQFYASHGLTWDIMTSGYGDGSKLKSNAVKKVIFDGPQGVWVMGPGKGISTKPAVIFGQTDAVAGAVAVDSDVSLNRLNVSKSRRALQLGIINTYNLYIDDCYLDGVEYGVYIPNGASSNAGETVHVRGGTITAGQSSENDTGYGIYSDALAFNLTCSHVHIDNVVNTVLKLGPHATYSHFRFNNCWVESFNKLVECPVMYVGNIPRVYFRDVEFEGRTNDGVTWGGPRQVIDAGTAYDLDIEGSTITYYRKPGKNCKTVALAGTDSKGMARIKHGSYFGAISAFMAPRPYPIDIASSIRGLALFSGTEGAEAITTFDTSQLILTKSEGATAVYGPTTDMDGKFQSIILTATATTDVVYIYPRHTVKLQRGDSIAASCSIKLNNATGNVNVSACLLNYFSAALAGTVSGAEATIKRTANLNSTIQGAVVEDALAYLAVSGTELTASDFVGVEPVWVSQNYTPLTDNTLTTGYEHSLPALKITGFVGSIHLALPFWWRI